MRLTSLKLANSVKCGKGEETMLTASKFDMELEGVTIRVQCQKTKDVTYTSLFNTAWWKGEPVKEKAAEMKPEPKGKAK